VDIGHAVGRGAAAATLMMLVLAAAGARANPMRSSFVKARLVQVDVYDRADGMTLPVYAKDRRNYIVGTPGHEYAVRIRNCTDGRVLVVTSVDGVNVISGDTAAPSQSGYVLDPWSSVEIAGWRKSMERTAAFYFTDLGDSYAARTGRPQNVGVVGVAVFQEKLEPLAGRNLQGYGAAGSADTPPYPESAPVPAPGESRQEVDADSIAEPAAAAPRARAEVATTPPAAKDSLQTARRPPGKLGTGHGRSEDSLVTMVAFERSTDSPVETVAIQYDRRENLAAMKVLPRPYFARGPQPDPFPAAVRFAADPPR
jgi:hypothetical protein